MHERISIAAIAFAALLATRAGAVAFDDAMYPDLKGQWTRITPPAPAGRRVV
jgi:hypothetical protein